MVSEGDRGVVAQARKPKEAPDLNNLADLLRAQPGRLAEARQLAEQALAIKQTLDPGAAQIWTTYNILAQIAEQEAQAATGARQKADLQTQAGEYRRLAREAKRNFAGTRHELLQLAPVILGAVAGCADKRKDFRLAEIGAELAQRAPKTIALPPSDASSLVSATEEPSATGST